LGAWKAKLPVPRLYVKLSNDVQEQVQPDGWATKFKDTIVHVERVIAYWSRSMKPAERNYSATEREALGAKEALVKFQPFIKGEQIILVTDHAALQWDRVYENANQRLAAWGAVFAAYHGLKIVHRAGRIHSNVDPLSRLPRVPPHNSPTRDDIPAISPDQEKIERAQTAEDKDTFTRARRAAFMALWWEDIIYKYEAYPVMTHCQAKLDESPEAELNDENPAIDDLPFPTGDHWTYPAGVTPSGEPAEEDWERRSHVLLGAKPEFLREFAKGYRKDTAFHRHYVESAPSPETLLTPSQFQKGSNGLLYFLDADWNSRLCIPKAQVLFILKWMHDSAIESAHAGLERLLARIRELFYWPRMARDVDDFAPSCDVCQKIKVDHRAPMGGLRPSHIPSRLFATVSLDLITGLPPSSDAKFTVILVIVDKLTKYAIIVPTHDGLTQEGFARIFVERVANVYGLPERIIADRDKRWSTVFWRSVVEYYGSVMALSSSHHPQMDSQTEVLNALIEQMLCAYIASDRASWARWLSEASRVYNSSVHGSTGYMPDFLLMGYQPRGATSFLVPNTDPAKRPFLPSQKAEEYIAVMERHRQSTRDALALAQERQARAYNKGRQPMEELQPGDLALVNPHTLKLVDVKGTGKKLVQKTIGPFEVMEKINPLVYRLRLPDNYPMHSIFNLAHLRKYRSSDLRFGERTTLPPTRDILNVNKEYEVEAILGHRLTKHKDGNHRMYLVRWRGFDPSEDSWVSDYSLRNGPEICRDYLNQLKK
jgi:hypothetical protein